MTAVGKCKWVDSPLLSMLRCLGDGVYRTVCQIHLGASRPRVHVFGGQVVAELAGAYDVVGERRAGAPVAKVVCTGVHQIELNRCFDALACHRALRGLVGDDRRELVDTARESVAEVIWLGVVSAFAFRIACN